MSGTRSAPRERLIEAMIAVTGRRGYAGASVARVIEGAGVSRATFYEHFADREDCFQAAYAEVAGAVERDLGPSEKGEKAVPMPERTLDTLLAAVERDPAAARVILFEALAGGADVRAEHEERLLRIEKSIDGFLAGKAGEGSRLEIPARGLLGGIGNVLASYVFKGEAHALPPLRDDLLTWIDSYSVPAGEGSRRSQGDWDRLGVGLRPLPMPASPSEDSVRPPLPRGRGALSRGAVTQEHRARIIEGVALMARQKGYTAMTVADIAAAASVTREAFYEQFRNKEDAFLTAQTQALQESVSHAAGEYFGATDWPDRVWNAGMALFSYMASVPDLAHMDVIESYAAGDAAIRRGFDLIMAYTLFLEDGYRQRPEVERPRICSEAIGGAALELIRRKVVLGEATRLVEVVPQGVYMVLAPFIGAAEALEFVEAKVALSRAR